MTPAFDIRSLNPARITSALQTVLERSAMLQSPEQKLVFAIIKQAISDALSSAPNSISPGTVPILQKDARRFLIERRMNGLCGLIDLDEDYAIELISRALECKKVDVNRSRMTQEVGLWA